MLKRVAVSACNALVVPVRAVRLNEGGNTVFLFLFTFLYICVSDCADVAGYTVPAALFIIGPFYPQASRFTLTSINLCTDLGLTAMRMR